MAQARQAVRQIPHTVIYIAAALAAAIILGAVVALGSFGQVRLEQPANPAVDRGERSPAVLQSGRDWQLQREQQSGYVDQVIQAGRDWEKQRRQQSGVSD